MLPHFGPEKFVVTIVFILVCLYVYYVNYFGKHVFLTTSNKHEVLNDSTSMNFTSDDNYFSNFGRDLNDSTSNFTSDDKVLSNLSKLLNVNDSTTPENFTSDDNYFSNIRKVSNDSTQPVNFTSDDKGLSHVGLDSNGSVVNITSDDIVMLKTPKFGPVSIIPDPEILTVEERNDILQLIDVFNAQQTIHNSETFGPVTSETFVVVIQVHFRFEYLQLLVQSLANAEGINNSFLIFSHDVYSPEMNAAIQQIRFARVLQIFLPYSRQTTPELYPGKSDGVGHGKVVRRAFAKQHWWWKTNFVFNKVNVLRKYEGVIHFLEEDDYVITDYIPVMKKLEVLMRENYCFGCNVLIAGHRFYGKDITTSWKNGTHNVAIVSDLDEPTVNRGLAFNRTLFSKLKACENRFCETYEESNWDSTLMEVSMGCMNSSRLTVLAPEAPRLFHVGDCGMHFRPGVCNPLPGVDVIKKYTQQYYNVLFPDTINLSIEFIKKRGSRREGGGDWAQSDAKLCLTLGAYGQVPSVFSLFNNSIN